LNGGRGSRVAAPLLSGCCPRCWIDRSGWAVLPAVSTLKTTTQQPEATSYSHTQVSSDLAGLAQQLDRLVNSAAAPSGAAAAASYCRLLSAVLRAQQQLQLPAQAATAISACLRRWLDAPCCTTSNGPPCEKLQLEAVSAMAELLPHHLHRLTAAERAAALDALAALLSTTGAGAEAQRQAAAVLGGLCRVDAGGGAGSKLTEPEVSAVLRALADALSACGSSGGSSGGGTGSSFGSSSRRPVEDLRHARLYGQLLRSCTAAVGAHRKGWGPQAGAICEALRRLMQYGAFAAAAAASSQGSAGAAAIRGEEARERAGGEQLAEAAAAAATVSSSEAAADGGGPAAQPPTAAGGVRYVPPHLRSRGGAGGAEKGSPARPSRPQQQQQQNQQQQQAWDESDASASDGGDLSDGDGRASVSSWRSSSSRRGRGAEPAADCGADAFATAALRVRTAALLLLQAMAQADPAALHPHWSSVLPSAAPAPAPRQPPPHLTGVLLHDPSPRARALAAATLASLLQGPQTRALLAVAEVKEGGPGGLRGRPAVRGFTTLSTSLGQIVLTLHQGLAAAVAGAAPQANGSSSGGSGAARAEQQQPAVVVGALRALCALCSATPYERMPSGLLPSVVEAALAAWQAGGCSWQPAGADSSNGGSSGVQRPAVAPLTLVLPTSGDDASSIAVAAAACIAQALSTKQPAPALGRWLSARPAGGELWAPLLHAARSPLALLRIEGLAALRGMCANYPSALPSPDQPAPLSPQDISAASDNGGVGSGGAAGASAWGCMLQAARASIVAAGEAALVSPRRSSSRQSAQCDSSNQRGGGGGGGGGGPNGSSRAVGGDAVSENGGPAAGSSIAEDKAAQHAVRLLGGYLAASSQRQRDEQLSQKQLPLLWAEAADLLLPQLEAPGCSPSVRASALAALADIDSGAWRGLPPARRSALLAGIGRAATADPSPAVRIAACKAFGTMVLLLPGGSSTSPGGEPTVNNSSSTSSSGGGGWDEEEAAALLRPLAAAAADAAAGVRQAAAWALANASDAVRSSQEQLDGCMQQQQQDDKQQQPDEAGAPLPPQLLRLLCGAALAGANDGDKARASGVRALGNLLAAWRPAWRGPGLSPSPHAAADGGGGDAGSGGAADSAATPDGWLGQALAALQSCLATGGMKTQWNACCAAAGLLSNRRLVTPGPAEVASRLPALLLALLMLVRDSCNFKIRTHAAAALEAPRAVGVYGDSYCDAVLIILTAMDNVETGGRSSSSSSSKSAAGGGGGGAAAAAAPAAAVGGGEDDAGGSFPNFRYIPGFVAQLRSTLLHLLQFAGVEEGGGGSGGGGALGLDAAARLREQLGRRRELLVRTLAAAQQRVTSGGGASGGGGVASGSGDGGALPADPFGQQQLEGGRVPEGACGEGSAVGAAVAREQQPGVAAAATAAAAAAGSTAVQPASAVVTKAAAALDQLLPGFAEAV
jgi:hypothetical protein